MIRVFENIGSGMNLEHGGGTIRNIKEVGPGCLEEKKDKRMLENDEFNTYESPMKRRRTVGAWGSTKEWMDKATNKSCIS